MSDCRLVIEIDYEPTLSSYPPDIKTKLDAMEFDVAAYLDGAIGLIDLVDYGDADVRVEKLDR